MFSAAEYERVLNECVQTITQEVATLKSMVDEFLEICPTSGSQSRFVQHQYDY
jgi:nitrogen fixation/metabolism regulation signal transduction histidine kinase